MNHTDQVMQAIALKRTAPKMYEYLERTEGPMLSGLDIDFSRLDFSGDDPALHGWLSKSWKKVKRSVKKVGKKVQRTVKKVLPKKVTRAAKKADVWTKAAKEMSRFETKHRDTIKTVGKVAAIAVGAFVAAPLVGTLASGVASGAVKVGSLVKTAMGTKMVAAITQNGQAILGPAGANVDPQALLQEYAAGKIQEVMNPNQGPNFNSDSYQAQYAQEYAAMLPPDQFTMQERNALGVAAAADAFDINEKDANKKDVKEWAKILIPSAIGLVALTRS